MKWQLVTSALLLLPPLSWAGMSDPTRPQQGTQAPAEQRDTPPSFRLQYVAVGSSGASAIINGKQVRVGDHVSGARVMSIQTGRVALRHAGERIILRLDHASIRRKRSQP